MAVDDISRNGKNYTFGIQLGLGSIDTDKSSETNDTETIGGFSYGYQYNSTWTINTGVKFGDSLCIVTCDEGFSANESVRTLDYNSYILNIKGSSPLSNRWSVFGKLGVNYYNVKFSGDNRASVTDNGVGALLAAGFDFRAYNGFGLGFEMTLLDMGIISSKHLTFNLSYMF